jgi:sensitive to high expression protein 9
LTLTSASASQRELNDLLQRKHTWSSSDVERFTLLVREDHQSSSAATHAKDEVERLEAEADKAFDGLMRAILQRYHEEQTWSDKLRSLSSYTQLLVLGVNALLFLGAVAVVEPWKRRRMVQGFEGRVREMTAELGSTFRAEIDGLRQEMAAGDLSPASKRPLDIPAATPSSSLPPTAAINAPSSGLALADDPVVLPPPSVAHLLEPATAPSSPAPLLLPHPTFPYHYPSPALLAMPVQAAMAAKERCVRAWADPNSSDRQFAVAAGVGAGVGALIVALCKG